MTDEIPAVNVPPVDPAPTAEPAPETQPGVPEPSVLQKDNDALVAENAALRGVNTQLETDLAAAKTKADEDAELIATLSSSLAKADPEPAVSLTPSDVIGSLSAALDDGQFEKLLDEAYTSVMEGFAPVYNPNSHPVEGQFAGEVHTIPPKTVKLIPRAAADHLCGEANAGGALHHAGVRKLVAATVVVRRSLGEDWREIVWTENERLVAEADSKAIG